MTIVEAHKKLDAARKKANRLRKQIAQLRKFIIDGGGNPDPAKVDVIQRNKKIFRKWKKGRTFYELAEEFGLSMERIRQLCRRIEKILELKGHNYNNYKNLSKYMK